MLPAAVEVGRSFGTVESAVVRCETGVASVVWQEHHNNVRDLEI